jgi:isoleucyl-tRNA synthetase
LQLVYDALYSFATVTLSARYFDIIKDRLYTFAPRSKARRSAQTALFRIADALGRMLGPILVFTADEIWENLPGQSESRSSVHLAEFPKPSGVEQGDSLLEWERLFEVRDQVFTSA